MELRLLIRQLVRYDKSGQNEQYVKLQHSKLVNVAGSLPAHRRFPNYKNFLDVTDMVSDLYQLKLTWTLERNELGLPSTGLTHQKKSATGTLVFEGEAYKYLKAWLIDDESASVNAVEVHVRHINCGDYKKWVIKSTDLSWCEGDICTFNVTLKQKDEALTCIQNTLITDNWQGWFGNTRRPSSGKQHPRFSYCNEMRPNGKLVTLWWTMTQLMSILGPFMLILAPIVNSIVFTLKFIIYPIINLVLGILNKRKLDKDTLNFINYKDIKDIFGNFFIESAGCGREHPAPLVRDYIHNVCSKCGVNVTADSAPIFFAQTITIETSADRQNGISPQTRENPHYNACYFHPATEKGVRRFDDLNIFNGAVHNSTDWWLPGNDPLLTLDELLDQLKVIYNCDWRVENNTLYFLRKDYWLKNTNAFDFSDKGADRSLLLSGLCYEWDETKNPLYCKGIYETDAADVCGNGAMAHMNGVATFGDIDKNPGYDGVLDKTTMFGAAKFRLDGVDTDYILDAMQQVINTTLITGSVWTTALFTTVSTFFESYADYALLLTSETVTKPKVFLWFKQHCLLIFSDRGSYCGLQRTYAL